MSQVTAMLIMFVMYGLLPAAGLYVGYRSVKKLTQPKRLHYQAMPKLGYVAQNSLPVDSRVLLDDINKKGEKLRLLYGDTNNDGKIDDKDSINETYVMVNQLLDEHIPQAVADYQRLHDLDDATTDQPSRSSSVAIRHSNLTGKQALQDVLHTIDAQFDDLLAAAYHEDGQKLLATNRYLKQRFDSSQW